MPHVLIIEDDPDIAHLLQLDLLDAGYHTTTATSVLQGLTTAREHTPDLILLDLGLPDGDGRNVLTRLRINTTTPVIILTARDTTEEKVELLNLGANDYLPKPFDSRELLARIAVQLRVPTYDVLTLGTLELYPAKKLVTHDGLELRFSPKEFEILEFLMRHPGRVFSRPDLFNAIWKTKVDTSSNLVDVHLANIRTKLRDAGLYGLLRTVRGVGYALKA
jgi:two-component system copper resistance phosphate regulon response regulator CusR